MGAVLHTDNNIRRMAGTLLGRCLLLQACCSEKVGHDLGRGEVVQCRTCAGCRTVTGVLQCDPGQPAGVVRAQSLVCCSVTQVSLLGWCVHSHWCAAV